MQSLLYARESTSLEFLQENRGILTTSTMLKPA